MGTIKPSSAQLKEMETEAILKELKASLEVLSSDELRAMRNPMYEYML